MWSYQQSTASMITPDDRDSGYKWYAGKGEGKNNPAMQDRPMIGPLPAGIYAMGLPILGSHMGPIVIPLHPSVGNKMFGRSGFYIHFDSRTHPGEASDGCIIVQANGVEAILTIWGSGDHTLEVIA